MAKQTSPRPSTSPSASKSAPKKKQVSEAPPSLVSVAEVAHSKPEPSHADIAQRAFALYQARGHSGGDPLHDWLTAERELAN